MVWILSLLVLSQLAFGQTSGRKAKAAKEQISLPADPRELGEQKYQELKAKGLLPQPKQVPYTKENEKRRTPHMAGRPRATPQFLIPRDGTFSSLGRCDDCSFTPFALPFAVNFYGTCYTSIYVNNNGNVTFGGTTGLYTPLGLPFLGLPMVAPFWADVDTRNAASGVVWYRVDSNRLIVIWDAVGYYGSHADKLNTFEVIISDGTDPTIGLGNNIGFSYGDMQWTTGDASSGSGGFGGVAAVVGINKGDGVGFSSIGRFNHEGTDYDGAGGANDGVSYLDNKDLFFNVSSGVLGTIQGTKFYDYDGDGVWEVGEPGLSGWTITVTGPVSASTVTDEDGNYSFTSLPAGTYTLSEVAQAGWAQSLPGTGNYTVVFSPGACVTRNFGNFRPGSISGRKFNDFNNNGADDGEPGLFGWTINLEGPVNRTTTTDQLGNYTFGNLPPGEYAVSEVQQSLWVQTFPSFYIYYLELDPGDNVTGITFGNRLFTAAGRGSISGTVFDDRNGNGRRDSGEPTLSGWRVEVTGRGVHKATLSDPNGAYSFTNLSSNTYTVAQFLPSAWTQTLPAGGQPYTIPLTTGGSRAGVDFGNHLTQQRTASIRGIAFDDRNGNGKIDIGEPGIPARRIELVGPASLSTVTDESGNFAFGNIPEGDYSVRQSLPAGVVQTVPTNGDPYSISLSAGAEKVEVNFGSRVVTAVDDFSETPDDFKLYQNFPNPFNPTTTLAFYLPKDSYATLRIYNVLGVEVAILLEGRRSAGTHTVVWDAQDLPSGIYAYRLTAGSFVAVRKMVLMK